MAGPKKKNGNGKRITRYTHEDVKEPRTPETGHTKLLPTDELTVTLPMENGWTKKMQLGRLPDDERRAVVVDMDPEQDPVLFWAGKRSKKGIPVLPLQRTEVVSESRIAQIIDRATKAALEKGEASRGGHLFADLERELREGDRSKRVEFYTHDEGWKNKLICGDSLQVMESLIHYEGLKGKVQMVYMDPPYGIKYDSNFQQRVDSAKNNEKDQADDVLTIKAFRDTWALGVHSYLSYLQERLYLCRELLSDQGSLFFQISDDNVHHARELIGEVFGEQNYCGQIHFAKATGLTSELLASVTDCLVWYCKDRTQLKYRKLFVEQAIADAVNGEFKWLMLKDGSVRPLKREETIDPKEIPEDAKLFRTQTAVSPGVRANTTGAFEFQSRSYHSGTNANWKTTLDGMKHLAELGRLDLAASPSRMYRQFLDDFPFVPITNYWNDVRSEQNRVYAVQTSARVVERCVFMTTDPGDLIFDPTCGSGTTATVSECYGRRWITCDTSRVAINVARQRLLSRTYPHFQTLNGAVSGGLKYRRVGRATLSTIAHNREPETIDLVDQPEVNRDATRVTGPFEVMSLGRYSPEDWKGYVVAEAISSYGIPEPAKLSNYIEVICRLYRKDAATQGASGLVHAVSESEKEKIAISVGPLSGRVTAKQISDAVEDAMASGILETHVLGWAFEANVGEIKSQLEKRGKVKVELVMIRPDTLAEGLKTTNPSMLFSPLALPDIAVKKVKNGKEPHIQVALNGVAVFNRKTRATSYSAADSGYVAAWYLDEDYDGDCFVDCQMFFDFKKTPNLKAALRAEIDPEEFKLQTESQPFPIRGYKRIAVKVVDVYGNESTVVKELA